MQYKTKSIIAALFGATCLFAATPALAVPASLTYQGKLFDQEGAPVTGTKLANFTLYDSATEGAIVWQAQLTINIDEGGNFAVTLGSAQSPLDEKIFTGEPLWLEIIMDNEALEPRLPINSTPYALRAKSVEDGAITLNALAPGLLDWNNIQNPPQDALTALNCANANDVPTWSGSAWGCAPQTTLTESQIDAFVANNGYITANPCAAAGQLLGWDGSAWSCAAPPPQSLTEAQVDAFVANNGYIAASPCANTGDALTWDGNAWSCSAIAQLDEAQVDAFVANNGYLTGPLTDATIPDNITISNTALHAPSGATQVGVNTTTTTAALTINGDINLERQSGTRTIGIPDGSFGGFALTLKAGGFAASHGSAGSGGNLTLQGGNSNLSQSSGACPDDSSGGGDIILRPGYNVTSFTCGAKRSGHVVFFGGDGPTQAEIMRVHGDRKNVGIGTNSPSASYKLHVAGVAAATSFTTLSDARFKTNVEPIDGALEKLTALRGVSYDWRHDEHPEMGLDKSRQLGFLAQELAVVLPEAVRVDDQGVHRVDYNKVIPVLVEGTKAQQRQLEALEQQLAQSADAQRKLEARLNDLERRQDLLDVTPRQASAAGLLMLLGLGVGAGLRRRRSQDPTQG